jgi:hypothetical protein
VAMIDDVAVHIYVISRFFPTHFYRFKLAILIQNNVPEKSPAESLVQIKLIFIK